MIGHDDGSILDVEGIKEVSELSRSYINVSRNPCPYGPRTTGSLPHPQLSEANRDLASF
jgi:hypothetical protein